jgi:hypothetical protein
LTYDPEETEFFVEDTLVLNAKEDNYMESEYTGREPLTQYHFYYSKTTWILQDEQGD